MNKSTTSTGMLPAIERRDDEPARIAREWLCESPYSALRRIRCSYDRGELTLSGELPDYYLKQIAQTIVARVPGVTQLINRIEVVTPLAPQPRHEENFDF